MTLRRALWLIVIALVVLSVAALVVVRRVVTPSRTTAPASVDAEADATTPLAHIRATLYYSAPEGDHLVSVVREVPLADKVEEQGRQILNVALHPPAAPLLPTAPPGTTLRGFYIAQGDAFVDLSHEAMTAHGGGSTAESLTVYAIVNSITANLPTVKRVQLLVDGKEVDSLAGHLDLRRPLTPNLALAQ